ncbi:hypothetical protein B0H19DRAFT_148781 [Mycena capillaripes]|nr:hypothetical protein B0H19DRAFT_148781 [Mycena capillaripes]
MNCGAAQTLASIIAWPGCSSRNSPAARRVHELVQGRSRAVRRARHGHGHRSDGPVSVPSWSPGRSLQHGTGDETAITDDAGAFSAVETRFFVGSKYPVCYPVGISFSKLKVHAYISSNTPKKALRTSPYLILSVVEVEVLTRFRCRGNDVISRENLFNRILRKYLLNNSIEWYSPGEQGRHQIGQNKRALCACRQHPVTGRRP